MEWKEIATNFGLPGLMIAAAVVIIRQWFIYSRGVETDKIASNERIEEGKRAVELERIKVEDKKADAMAAALGSLSGKIDTHHTSDLQSHSEMASEIGNIHGKLDQALIDRTPVRGVPHYADRPKTTPGGR